MENQTNYTDLSYLEEISGGDSDFIQEIIQLFIDQMPQSIEEMKAGYEENDPVRVGEAAHKSKPSAIYVGNKTLEERLKTLQNLKNTQQFDDQSKELIKEVETLSNKVIEELKERI